MMNMGVAKILYAISILLPVLIGANIVDFYPRLSRLLRILGFTIPPILFLSLGLFTLLDYQLVLTVVTVIVAIGVSLHSEAYYRTLYAMSRYFQVVVDTVLAVLILLFSSSYFVELLVYWLFLDVVVALVAITMEYGVENLPVASTYIVMCIAPSDLALLTIWALLASNYGLIPSLFLELNTITQSLTLDPIASIILVFGFATKIGQFPLHSWLPIVHTKSPTHISAILSGLIIKMGAYGYFLIIHLFKLDTIAFYILLVQGLISIVYGAFGATLQTHIKQLLAYSSVSYGGIITAFYAMYVLTGIDSLKLVALFVIAFHALTKSLSFLNTGLVYQVANTYDVYKLGYLFYVTRKGALAAFTALLNLTGVPPSIGFIVKILLLTMSITLASTTLLALPLTISIVIASIFSIAYGVKFLGVYTAVLPRTPPKPVPIPSMELTAELYLGVTTLLSPLVLLIYMLISNVLEPLHIGLVSIVYTISLLAYILLFTRIYTKPEMPEDIKYWLSGVEI